MAKQDRRGKRRTPPPAGGRRVWYSVAMSLDGYIAEEDGGYGWIALRRPVPGLFDHAMSTATVLADTTARAAAAGLRVLRLAPHFDLDTAADLALLAAARERGETDECPRTLAAIDALGLWRHAENLGSRLPPI